VGEGEGEGGAGSCETPRKQMTSRSAVVPSSCFNRVVIFPNSLYTANRDRFVDKLLDALIESKR
jgi:hypothetical protein